MKRYWVCSLLGHRSDDPEAYDDPFTMFVCSRCGGCDYYYYDQDFSHPWHVMTYWRWKAGMLDWKNRFMAWLGPCGDCGRRFGRHDESVDHLPF